MKRFYDIGEVMNYEHIENEWPLFYLYMIVDGMFEDDQEQVRFFSSAAKEAFLCSFLYCCANFGAINPCFYRKYY